MTRWGFLFLVDVIQDWRRRFAMSACIALRGLAKRSRDPRQVRRLLALAAAYDGMSRAEAAKVGGMQTRRSTTRRRSDGDHKIARAVVIAQRAPPM